MSLKTIYTALTQHLEGGAFGIDTAWENVDYTPTTGTAWMRPTLLPGTLEQTSLGPNGLILYRGTYQVSLFYPRGAGYGAAYDMADQVLARFRIGAGVPYNNLNVIISSSRVPPALEEPDWYQVPVEIDWYTYAQR